MKRTMAPLTGAAIAVSLAFVAGCGGTSTPTSDGDDAARSPGKVPILAEDDRITRGPNGEAAENSDIVTISDEDVETVRAGGYTAALMWDAQTTWFDAVSSGALDVFDDLGIEVVAQTSYDFDLARQKEQVETVMALDPDIILTIADDPVISGEALRPAVEAGVKIVLLSTNVDGWTAGEEFVGMVTGDQAGMGAAAATALADAIGNEGEVGVLYHDANYFVTNRRDQMFVTKTVTDFDAITIVAEQGFTTPDQAEELTSAMLVQNPNITGLYAAWDAVTQSALSALAAAGRDDVRVVTMDLGVGTAVNLAEGGQVIAIISEQTYELGRTMATAAALAMVDHPVPPFVVVPAVTVTRDTLVEDWQNILRSDPPAEVLAALGK